MSETRVRMCRRGLHAALLQAAMFSALVLSAGAHAAGEGSVTFLSSPPMPGEAAYNAAAQDLAAQVNQPITGASHPAGGRRWRRAALTRAAAVGPPGRSGRRRARDPGARRPCIRPP